ncbi:MAG TPA: DUF3892 domain-containing protein [Solirubrobacterales bacterium]|nr:DUF3892 domain-containing protein [Solirubrobacterales bacterium]
MADPAEHEALYASLRAKVLARHFALGRHFRANHISLDNHLTDLPEHLDHLPEEAKALIVRWNVTRHERENPLMEAGRLFAALSVEHHLGHPKSAAVLERGLETIGSLYPFTGDWAGSVVRWDPVTSDRWVTDAAGTPVANHDFLIGDGGGYAFCVRSDDHRSVPLRNEKTLGRLQRGGGPQAYMDRQKEFVDWHRRWEASMDELAGLVAAYSIVDRLVAPDDQAIGDAVRDQVTRLGGYLADNGYFLLRRCGGINARGGTGALPAMELPFGLAFSRIAGDAFASRLGFKDAMDKAGYWENLDGPVARWVAAAYAGTVVVGGLIVVSLGPFAALVGGPLVAGAGAALSAAAAAVVPSRIGTAVALYEHRDCFDVWKDDQAREVAFGYLMKEFPARTRFQIWMEGLEHGIGSHAANFPAFLGLATLDDGDSLVRDKLIPIVRDANPPELDASRPVEEQVPDANKFVSAFATAVAVVSGATDLEQRLLDQLDRRYDLFAPEEDAPVVAGKDGPVQKIILVLDYLAALALAWLHAERRAAAGSPVATAGFPVPPAGFSAWPEPTVPRVVLEHLPEVRRALLASRPLPAGDVDAFGGDVELSKPPTPAPALPPPASSTMVWERTYRVRESDRDVYTGITLEWGDEYEIEASGEIRAHPLERKTGPEGLDDERVDDARWPLHAGIDPDNPRPYALLARVGGWFHVGAKLPRRRFLGPRPLRLFLRINDRRPGNGSGQLSATVRLWGRPRQVVVPERRIECVVRTRPDGRRSRRIEGVGGSGPDGTTWRLSTAEAVLWADNGHEFVVGDDEVPVTTVRSGKTRYLRTHADATTENNLLELPDCPP